LFSVAAVEWPVRLGLTVVLAFNV